jgi:Asp-tRNA(Asn)/Glu-tRNA(Gln) amidotransferase A subunit family amidase
MNALHFESASSMARMVAEKQISPLELIAAHLARIERLNPTLNAITYLDAEGALAQARAAEEAVGRGEELGPLHGVPITIKSSIDVKGMKCECGSKLRQGHVSQRDATLVVKLREAGAIILGTTNVPDLLMAYESDNLLYGRTNSPWDLERTPGGSSGGESAAIAAGLSAAGFGSDGGGSVRVPAHFSGIYGLKPTPGVIPRTGHWPACLGPSAFLGLVGPMARSAEDLELLLRLTADTEYHDPNSAPVPVAPPSEAELLGARIGWFTDNGIVPVTPETEAAVGRAAKLLSGAGFSVEPYQPSGVETAHEVWWTLFGVAGATLVKPLAAGREDELHPVTRELLAGDAESSAMTYEAFLGAWVARDRLRSKLLGQMETYRVLLSPVAAVPAFRHGERCWRVGDTDVPYSKAFSYSTIYNLLGNPAVAAPVGRSPDGMPIGVQIIGRPYEDALVVAVARKLEEAMGGWQAPPNLD